ncbi:MAG: aspartate dehydrogenase domain-containing protein [Candidatus Omnitrophota bacterium]
MTKKMVSIIGCGTIGTAIAMHIDKTLREKVSGIMLFDENPYVSQKLKEDLSSAFIADSLDKAIEGADLVIEAASSSVVGIILRKIIDQQKDAMFMSIGGLLGQEKLLEEAEEKGIKIILPSGAISGIDALKAAKISGITSVKIITRKPPKALSGAPFIVEKGIDLEKIKEETVIFEGNALEAMKGFPKNINVSALLSLAGIGPEKTLVKIVSSSEYTKNSHEIIVESKAGSFTARTENAPSPNNPKTSYLAALAAMAAVNGYFSSVRIGT